MTKKYMLFAGENYYPCGGADDFIGFFDTIDEAREAYQAGYVFEWNNDEEIDPDNIRQFDWGHVAESTTLQVVLNFRYSDRYTNQNFKETTPNEEYKHTIKFPIYWRQQKHD